MSRVSETIISMMDKGHDILDIAKYFGGIGELMNMTKKYPYLHAMIQTKLGGQLHCSAEGEDEVMVPFSLNFMVTELEEVDMDDMIHYNASVNIIIPELTEGKEMQILSTWLGDYLSDLGAEVGSFNDSKLNKKMIWIYSESINGKSFRDLGDGVSDTEVLEIIPQKYIGD